MAMRRHERGERVQVRIKPAGDVVFQESLFLNPVHAGGHDERHQRGRDRPDRQAILRDEFGDDRHQKVEDDADEDAGNDSFHE